VPFGGRQGSELLGHLGDDPAPELLAVCRCHR
jgi:hypothetical protein